jgi:hypothetical protein
VLITVTDQDTPLSKLKVELSWSIDGFPDASGSSTAVLNGSTFYATVGPMSWLVTQKYETSIDLTVTASDGTKSATPVTVTGPMAFVNCRNG